MKIVLFKNVKHDYEGITEFTDDKSFPFNDSDLVVLSKATDIDFKMLDQGEITDAQVAVIDKQMTKVRADAEASITALEGRKQELLSIGHEQ